MTVPEPMTPFDCDLRGLEYMPLLGQRLFGSEFDALATDSEWRAGVTLWWAAWTQCPAGSLPDDDVSLCRLADLGRDLKTWKRLKERALHGFVKCSDGRLYHPTLAQQALVAWDKRQQDRNARAGDAERKARERAARSELFRRLAAVGVTPEWNVKTADLRDLVTQHCPSPSDAVPPEVTPPVTRTVTAKTGRDETGRDVKKKKSSEADASARSASEPDDPPDPAAAAETHLWATGKRFLEARGVSKSQAGAIIGRWKGKHGTASVIEALGVAQVEPDLVDPIPFIERVLQRRSGKSNDDDGYRIGGVLMASPC